MTHYLKGNNNSNNSRFLIRNHEVRKNWHIFQVMKEKNFSPEFYLQSKYSSRMKVKKQTNKKTNQTKAKRTEVKNSLAEGRLRKFVASRSALKQQLNDVLHRK